MNNSFTTSTDIAESVTIPTHRNLHPVPPHPSHALSSTESDLKQSAPPPCELITTPNNTLRKRQRIPIALARTARNLRPSLVAVDTLRVIARVALQRDLGAFCELARLRTGRLRTGAVAQVVYNHGCGDGALFDGGGGAARARGARMKSGVSFMVRFWGSWLGSQMVWW